MENTMEAKKVSKDITQENKHEEWFSSFIDKINSNIKEDKKNLESGNASKDVLDFYNSLIMGDHVKAMGVSRKAASNIIIQEIIVNYLKLLVEKKINISKLALDISTNKVLVWAEIKEDDESSEMGLIRVESIVNGKFLSDTGIHLDSIIVEDCDSLPIPAHYKTIGES